MYLIIETEIQYVIITDSIYEDFPPLYAVSSKALSIVRIIIVYLIGEYFFSFLSNFILIFLLNYFILLVYG